MTNREINEQRDGINNAGQQAKKTDSRIQRLLEMQEHPERYTDEDIRQLMADEECRQLYEQMIRAADALFSEKERSLSPLSTPHSPLSTFPISLRKIAAMLIGVLMLSGIAYAAFRYARNVAQTEKVQTETMVSSGNQHAAPGTQLAEQDSTQTKPVVYEDKELTVILNEIAAFYQLETVYKNEDVKHVRLYFTWDKSADIDDVIATFNKFDRIHITRENQKLIVK
jgi:hypothetical protein